MDRFYKSVPCLTVKIDPEEKKREKRRFRKISPVFSSLLFFEKIPIHFAIFSDRKDLNPRKRDFQKKRNRIEQPKGLEPATRVGLFRFFVLVTKCLQIVYYKTSPSLLQEDLNPRKAENSIFQNRSICHIEGLEPANRNN